jgi:potassium-transporting ATPase KdpC subunit
MLEPIMTQVRPAFRLLVFMTLLTGLVYPLAITGISQIFLSHQANGSLVVREGKEVGSELIGQYFDAPSYFWGRPSATTPYPYNASSSSGSNLGPTHPALGSLVKTRAEILLKNDPKTPLHPPIDLVTSSASGLDPHISPAAAFYQVSRVAQARGVPEQSVRVLVLKHVEKRQFGFLGEARVNVLLLNRDVDSAFPLIGNKP